MSNTANRPAEPSWAIPGSTDPGGNVTCKVCSKKQSPDFKACFKCCNHEELEFTERWHGNDEHGSWELELNCAICGASLMDVLQIRNNEILKNYKVVRRGLPAEQAKALFSKLSDEERIEVFADYCKACGTKDPKCQCWNDG